MGGRRKVPKLFSESVGMHRFRVQIRERRPGGNYYIRAGKQWKGLGHRDLELARQEARKLAATLFEANGARARGTLTVTAMFAYFEAEVVAHRRRPLYAYEDRFRIDLWTAHLGTNRDVLTIDAPTLDDFVRARREARIQLPERRKLKLVKLRSIEHDLMWLSSVLTWATRKRVDGIPLLAENPVGGYAPGGRDARRLANRAPMRPRTTYERFLKIDTVADAADPQRQFRWFHRLLEATGWRGSAICGLRRSDVDLRAYRAAPYGKMRKPSDKIAQVAEGEDVWVPLSQDARTAIDELLKVRGGIVGEAWLFPMLRFPKRHWTRGVADHLLRRCEKKAGVPHLKGGSMHPYGRKWFTERKHHPVPDVAAAGDCTPQNVLRYSKADEQTVFAVVNEPRKLVDSVA